MKNTLINKAIIKRIAVALGELNEKVIYVGGATVSLYINDSGADDVRPTKDIDISVKVASLSELENIREELNMRGFKQTADLDVICRFKYDDIAIQIMPLSFFLASKFTAFEDRGGDPRFSHDFEDITYILDNRMDWDSVLLDEKDNEVKSYLKEQLNQIKDSDKFQEAIIGNLYYDTSEERFQRIMQKIESVLSHI